MSDVHDWGWLLRAETFAELVSARAATTPDAILLHDEQEMSVTCRGFAERANRIAATLSLRGATTGEAAQRSCNCLGVSAGNGDPPLVKTALSG